MRLSGDDPRWTAVPHSSDARRHPTGAMPRMRALLSKHRNTTAAPASVSPMGRFRFLVSGPAGPMTTKADWTGSEYRLHVNETELSESSRIQDFARVILFLCSSDWVGAAAAGKCAFLFRVLARRLKMQLLLQERSDKNRKCRDSFTG
ncbi:hypothetical protein F1559_004874 [Cyanidiococcus yangmingshanensis]|uniref:Uncharacterized protein n=1 Tax=Cyanidiococcus yangmingshanensis TaxID=2690220 RepID=A0A7J7IQK3_9RHOD|nr:hypothetical protein F1559_004874 [Cyanidiococcus yangmingshanensis]